MSEINSTLNMRMSEEYSSADEHGFVLSMWLQNPL